IDSKQPDKVLFDRAMDALKKNRFDVARVTLQTLINTYPDSEYVARAKLAIGDAWYKEGGSTGLAQAEIEYKDFITFFPNMPEAAEAQLKVANIHYKQMEKPDRDYEHEIDLTRASKRLPENAKGKVLQEFSENAAAAYDKIITHYPTSPEADLAKKRLVAMHLPVPTPTPQAVAQYKAEEAGRKQLG